MSTLRLFIASSATFGAFALAAAGPGCGGSTSTPASPDAGPDIGADTGPALTDAGFDIGVASDAPGSVDTGAGTDSSPEAAVPTPAPDYAWYVLDETSGTTAHDSTSNHFDVPNIANVTWGQGASFDGTGGGGITMVDERYRTLPLTITAWLRPRSRSDGSIAEGALQPFPPNALSGDVPGIGGYGMGLNVWSDGAGGSALAAEGVDTCKQAGLCVANQDVGDAGPACTMPQACNAGFVGGTEYFVAVAIGPASDAGPAPEARVYVDGQLWDLTTAEVVPSTSPVTLALGEHNGVDGNYLTHLYFAGRIRDARVYTRQVGAAEIAQLYANGPTTQAPPAGDP